MNDRSLRIAARGWMRTVAAGLALTLFGGAFALAGGDEEVGRGAPAGGEKDSALSLGRLGAPRYADRESASLSLLEGRLDMGQLREALSSGDPEIRWRAEELLDQIEQRAIVLPTRIPGLDRVNLKLDALKRIEDAAGCRFDHQLTKELTIAHDSQRFGEKAPTFWEALEKIGLDASWDQEVEPRRGTWQAEPTLQTRLRQASLTETLNGPFRLVIREISPMGGVGVERARPRGVHAPGQAEPKMWQLRLDLLCEPRLRFRMVEPLRVLQATDRGGRVVLVENELPDLEGRPSDLAAFGGVSTQAVILRQIGVLDGSPLRLTVRARLELEARRPEPTVVPLQTTLTEANLSEPVRLDDASLTALRVDLPAGSTRATLDLTIQPDDLGEFLANRRFGRQRFDAFSQLFERPLSQFELVDKDGQKLRVEPSRRVTPAAQGFRMIAPLIGGPGAGLPSELRLYTSIRAASDWTFEIDSLVLSEAGR